MSSFAYSCIRSSCIPILLSVLLLNSKYLCKWSLASEVESGIILDSPVEDIQRVCMKYLPFSATVVLPWNFSKYQAIICFDIKCVCNTTDPFIQIDSIMWHELPRNILTKRESENFLLSMHQFEVT